MGNRTDSNQNGLSNFNAGNQLADDVDFTYVYDNNGNLTQKTNKSTSVFTLYQYDAENKLIRVVREDGSIVNYRHDGLGRRIEKEVDTVVTRYIYDNEDILLELDGSNNILARYTHGPGIDEPLIMEKGGASFFYHNDALGSVTDLTDNAGTLVQSYTYSSFGKIESQLDPTFVQPYTFTARELDQETGLYFYRARYYDQILGRFISQDSWTWMPDDERFRGQSGLIRDRGSNIAVAVSGKDLSAVNNEFLQLGLRAPIRSHRYLYTHANPVRFTDPSGHGVVCELLCTGGCTVLCKLIGLPTRICIVVCPVVCIYSCSYFDDPAGGCVPPPGGTSG